MAGLPPNVRKVQDGGTKGRKDKKRDHKRVRASAKHEGKQE